MYRPSQSDEYEGVIGVFIKKVLTNEGDIQDSQVEGLKKTVEYNESL